MYSGATAPSAGLSPVSVVHSMRQEWLPPPPTEATPTGWPFPTTSRHLGGSHPCITALLNQRLNVEVVLEVGCCKCGISKAHALLSRTDNAAHCVWPQVSILMEKRSHKQKDNAEGIPGISHRIC